MTELVDVQGSADLRGIPIEMVGIDRLRYPITVDDGSIRIEAVATCELAVALPAEHRGTHMSRMVEFVDESLTVFDPRESPTLLKDFARKMGVDSVSFSVRIPFASTVISPATARSARQVHDAELRAVLRDDKGSLATSVRSEVTSLCPCSKAISDYGAHNQRSEVSVTAHGAGDTMYPVKLETLAEEIGRHGSAPVAPLVKRTDERFLTMQAYEQPKFVEDIVRDLSAVLRTRGVAHRVAVRNLESIHSHDAVARLSWAPRRAASPQPSRELLGEFHTTERSGT